MPPAAPTTDPPPAERYMRGVVWSALNAGAGVLLPLGIFVVFARWLPAREIGVVALAVAAAEVIKAFGLPGLYEALLQEREDRARAAEAALGVLLLAGVLMLGGYLALTPLLVRLVPEAGDVGLAFALLGLRIPIDLAALQPQASLAERLDYRRLALRSVVATLGAGAIGLGLAHAGQPFWGLVTYQIGLSLLTFLVTAIGTSALARPRLHGDCLRRMWGEAARASAVRLIAAVNNSLDQVLMAGLVGSLRLAHYNLAKRVETVFITAAASFSSILFQPVFARRTTGGDAVGLRRGLAVLTTICGAAAAVVIVAHERLVTLVFGAAWAEAAPLVALLAVGGFARALGSVHGALLSVSGRNHKLLRVSIVSAVSGLAIVVVLVPVGLLTCAAALAMRSLLTTTWMAWQTRRDLPGLGRAYGMEVLLPFGLMLAAAWGGSAAAARVAAVQEMPGGLLALGLAGVMAFGAAGLYFGIRLVAGRWTAALAGKSLFGLLPGRPSPRGSGRLGT